jgi:5-carboxymethyl-2-hydroxymuconate isomerase
MPHLVILYTPNLEARVAFTPLCRRMADTMLALHDEAGKPVFPKGGTRVLAYPAAHFAVGDDGSAGRAAGGTGEYAFVYMNVRMAKGRSAATHKAVGEALALAAREMLAPVMAQLPVGLTLQVDEGHEVFDAKHSTLHPLFAPTPPGLGHAT